MSSAFVHAGSDTLKQFGDVAQFGVPLAAGSIAILKGDEEGLFQLVEGAMYTSLATHAMKASVSAQRPDGSSYDSFPSGHTSAATQGAAFLQFRYGWEYGLPAYAIASVVGYSRVDADRHYWRDVGAGAILATGIQYAVTNMGYSMTNVVIMPYFKGKETGVHARIEF
ncbi:phosphatase PAP2 family protein [Vibrio sp. S4M6]|uniref:phosphatase PAP2 family protein n=1 Tax=Vibrio sinus TaxID=2946865 RepID=UPI00202ABA45|nr:phosphatase PAP2 family protein [Vibrio sinus]